MGATAVGRTSRRHQSAYRPTRARQGRRRPLELWYAVAAALDLPLKVELARDRQEDAADAGHLKIQELVLRLGRLAGRRRTFELPTKPADPALSTDVCLRDTRRNRQLLARYPEVFASTFTGSSAGWVRALTEPGVEPPDGLGLVWCDRDATRLFARRRRT